MWRLWSSFSINVLNDSADPSLAVKAEVSPTSAKVGDVVMLEIRVEHPLTLVIDPPTFAKELGAFEIRTSTQLPVELQGDKGIDRFRAELQSFTTGQHKLPGLEVPYHNAMGQAGRVKTPELVVTIEEFPPGPKDKGDIRGIVGAIGPVAWPAWWLVFAAILFSALCLLLWRKRQRARQGPPPPPPIPPDQEALAKLRELEASTLLANGKIKEFYSALSDIVRLYLEQGFKVMALERTTAELMRDLRRNPHVQTDWHATLRHLLEACDLVKFAKFRPSSEEGKEELNKAIQFVEHSRSAVAKK